MREGIIQVEWEKLCGYKEEGKDDKENTKRRMYRIKRALD